MAIQVGVLLGSVKWFPQGSHRDAPSELLHQGATVDLKPSHPPPVDADIEKWKKEVVEDKNAPAVGSASTKEDWVNGAFSITTDGAPVLVRLYVHTQFNDFVVIRGKPFLMATLEGNAVTVALYGVTAV